MRPTATLKALPDDFVVEEIPAYEASGQGEHLFIAIKKRGITTDQAVRVIGDTVRMRAFDIGIAGLKDAQAVTTQTISILWSQEREAALEAFSNPAIEILSMKRHGNKLKTGHLRGNRFRIWVRGVDSTRSAIETAFARVARDGVPNAYGAQRFGREGDNAAQALTWLQGDAPPPRDAKKRRFLFSSLQSKLFNDVLAARVSDKTWNIPTLGDVLVKEPRVAAGLSGGPTFTCESPELDIPRAAAFEVSPTGPMYGVSMRQVTGHAKDVEDRILKAANLESFDWARWKSLGEGARRSLRLAAENVEWQASETQDGRLDVWTSFVLPKGAYATTFLGEIFSISTPAPSRATESGPGEL